MSNRNNRKTKQSSEGLTLSDALDEDVLEKLKAAKQELTAVERENEKKRQEEIRQERKQREKNKSFEELLEEYGDVGSKF